MTALNKIREEGFTLVELLIVIAIIGVLAVVVLVAINPVQQLARTRDSGRKSGVTQIGHAMEAYATTHNGVYPADATWDTDIVAAGELSIVPAEITKPAGTDGPACATNVANATWCYDSDDGSGGGPIIVFAGLESDSERSNCNVAGGENAWFVYATVAGRGGISCSVAEPTAAAFTAGDFVN
jgi:prepilin-type N-terminal cleavage/methylation domain-containing protein